MSALPSTFNLSVATLAGLHSIIASVGGSFQGQSSDLSARSSLSSRPALCLAVTFWWQQWDIEIIMADKASTLSSQQLLLPDTYSGQVDFDSWEKHFSTCTRAKNWNKERKILILPTLLCSRAVPPIQSYSGLCPPSTVSSVPSIMFAL